MGSARSALAIATVAAVVTIGWVSSARAQEQGEWRFGGRLISIDVDAVSKPLFDTESKVGVESATTLEFDTTYMLGETWGLEMMFTVAPHDAKIVDGVFNGLDLGSVWMAQTTITVNYAIPLRGRWRPYLGAGLGAGYFVYSDTTAAAESIGVDKITSNLGWGPVGQVGLAHRLNRSWILSLDLKWLDLPIDLRLERPDGGRETVEMDLDPLIIGLGGAYRF